MAYKVSQDVFEHLDHREKNSYLGYEVDIHFKSFESKGGQNTKRKNGLVYIAPEDNDAFLGYVPEHEIAEHIHSSSGTSGHNRDYVFQLAAALQALGNNDQHVLQIDRILKQLKHSA